MTLGHENTGEVVEVGPWVEFIKKGDLVSVPVNLACGTAVTAKVDCAAYGFNLGWNGGQAEYMMVPWADFQLLKFPDKAQAMEKIKDLTLHSDILPTGFHGCVTAGVKPGMTV